MIDQGFQAPKILNFELLLVVGHSDRETAEHKRLDFA